MDVCKSQFFFKDLLQKKWCVTFCDPPDFMIVNNFSTLQRKVFHSVVAYLDKVYLQENKAFIKRQMMKWALFLDDNLKI